MVYLENISQPWYRSVDTSMNWVVLFVCFLRKKKCTFVTINLKKLGCYIVWESLSVYNRWIKTTLRSTNHSWKIREPLLDHKYFHRLNKSLNCNNFPVICELFLTVLEPLKHKIIHCFPCVVSINVHIPSVFLSPSIISQIELPNHIELIIWTLLSFEPLKNATWMMVALPFCKSSQTTLSRSTPALPGVS